MVHDKRRLPCDISDEEEAAIQAGIAADPDSPELTDVFIRDARPAAEIVPHIVAAARKARGPQKSAPKQLVSLRLSRAVIEGFRATGPGWQARIDEALGEYIRKTQA